MILHVFLRIFACLASMALVMTCGPVSALDHKFKVATTFTVIADMAANVAGDAAVVVSITKPGAEIHGYEPTPKDILRAQDADLILWNGMGLELWFEQFFHNLDGVPSAILTEGIKPISISAGSYKGRPNPHAWMSLESALVYVDNIRDALAEHDPENAAAYRANAAAYAGRIRDAIAPLRMAALSIPEPARWLATCEGAFSYLARDFGLRELYLWPINADQIGSPRQVAGMIDAVRSHGVRAVFCESTVSDEPVRQVARETGVSFGGVLYVDSLSGKDGPVPTYLDLLRVTSQTVVEGLTQ